MNKFDDSPIVIKVDDVFKDFKLPHEKSKSVKSLIVNPFRKKSIETQHALRDISFEVKEGEFFGIIGRNGCGKSTLLKMIAGIYQPTKGSIKVLGKVSPFLELGVGFNPELTGKENVFLNGALLGFSKKEITNMYDEIVGFAELHEFMDQKLINYSSGMQVRLAFAVAIQAKADILLIDEVLAVGDANFQEKCRDQFKKMKQEGRTIVFVTHDMNSVRQFCTRAILINNNRIIANGDVETVTDMYDSINLKDSLKKQYIPPLEKGVIVQTGKIFQGGHETTGGVVDPNKPFSIKINYKNQKKVKILNVGVGFHKEDGTYLGTYNTFLDEFRVNENTGIISIEVANLPVGPGKVYLNIALYGESKDHIYDYKPSMLTLNIVGKNNYLGILNLDRKWSQK
jgi:ABC-type polysaccharide/polyol phosphate transport system ATPase subunit